MEERREQKARYRRKKNERKRGRGKYDIINLLCKTVKSLKPLFPGLKSGAASLV